MGNIFSKAIRKLSFHYNYRCIVNQWVIGISRGNLADIIRNKQFNPDITWIDLNDPGHQQADPFILNVDNGSVDLLIEDYRADDNYAKIASMHFNPALQATDHKIVLDTGSHLSYPHIFRENNRVFVLPEASKSGKLSCYEYVASVNALVFLKDIIELPLLDANVLKYKDKYWVFGVTRPASGEDKFELCGFYADQLLGPYTAHPANPLAAGLDGVRGAGDFFAVDGFLYRPTQNCKEVYGKSITINKITRLDEAGFESEPYMTIMIDQEIEKNRGIHTLHTLNGTNGIIVVDGTRKKFAPLVRYKEIKKEKRG